MGETVPFVWMLFPLQPGYTITVWAEASDQLATTNTSSVNRNMAAMRTLTAIWKRCGWVLLFCNTAVSQAVHAQMVVDATRQRAVAGAISTYGLHRTALGASCYRSVFEKSKWSMQANERSKTAPPARPASACQPSKH